METKKQIRNEFKRRRKNMSLFDCSVLSNIICDRIINTNLYKQAHSVLLYSPIQNEVDLNGVVSHAIKAKKKVYLPKVFGEDMEFYRVKRMDTLTVGSFNILEPTENEKYVDSPEAIIFVPGIAFSNSGARIGFGKGYYDKYLRNRQFNAKIGVAYEWQTVEKWYTSEFDINMDAIITEKREGFINE